MNNFFSYLRLLLLATSGMLLLCIIFAMNPELADGTLSGKICWFHFTSLLLAGGVLLMEFTTKKSRFIFSLPDALLLLLFGIVLVSYDKDENLQPERFRPSGGSAIPSILLPSPILSSGCLKHRWNQSLSMAISQSFFQSVWTHYSVLRIATRSLCGNPVLSCSISPFSDLLWLSPP